MEVAPTAHYSMGGIKVSAGNHETKIDGLFAAGEVAGGLHGANRLGGNSLAEILVFGRRVGKAATTYSKSTKDNLDYENKIFLAKTFLEKSILITKEIQLNYLKY